MKALFEKALALPQGKRKAFLRAACGDDRAKYDNLVSLLANYLAAYNEASDNFFYRVEDILDQALELPPEDRPMFLNQACGDDLALRAELDSLLAEIEHAPDDNFLDRPALAAFDDARPEADDPLGLIGQRISHYEVVEKLGGGGMGVVYKARHGKLARYAALKFLPLRLSTDDEARARFENEARAASALDHANICTIYDIDQTDSGQLFIAMAFYEGETLKQRIARGPLPVEEALGYAMQVAEGLSKAHAAGIVHRDVKPANLMVDRDGVVKLVDFGVAKMAEHAQHLTQTGSTIGTVSYMSPEQAQGEEVDARTDLWSLGVILYEMLTGEQPYQGTYPQTILYKLLNTDAPPLTEYRQDVPSEVVQIVTKCLEKDREQRYQTAAALFAVLYRARRRQGMARRSPSRDMTSQASESGASSPGRDPMERARIFVSYKRNATPDDRVAEAIYQALCLNHEVFIDKLLLVGTRWVEQIEAALARSDFMIILLSEHSIRSEMVLGEIEMAQRLARERGGRPVILPVRLAYNAPFDYPLSAYLDHLNWAYWEGADDTPRLIAELEHAISGGTIDFDVPSQAPGPPVAVPGAIPEPLAAAQPPPRLEKPEGTMDPHSGLYVERPADRVVLEAIAEHGVTITIKGPRQMGKSSLLMRTMAAATKAGKEVVFLDFQLFDRKALGDADTFFRQFCAWITDELDLEDQVEAYWQRPLGNSQLCTQYVGRHLLKSLGRPLLLAMDEVERIFDTDFRSDFFSMLRSWHNDRAIKPRWRRLDLALVTSTEPYQLIEDLNQSPFNVGEVIALTDFTPEQVADLNARHGAPVPPQALERLMALLNGHPYLTRKALFLVASGRIGFEELMEHAVREDSPFGDHLRHHLFRLHGQEDLIDGLREVLRSNTCPDEGIFWRLRGAGLVRWEGDAVVPRCNLYADYFRERLHG